MGGGWGAVQGDEEVVGRVGSRCVAVSLLSSFSGRLSTFADVVELTLGGRTGTVTQPRILLTHTPLYRPEGTLCGRLREHSRPIYQGAGKNYQNELDEQKTRWLVERVRPSLVYS